MIVTQNYSSSWQFNQVVCNCLLNFTDQCAGFPTTFPFTEEQVILRINIHLDFFKSSGVCQGFNLQPIVYKGRPYSLAYYRSDSPKTYNKKLFLTRNACMWGDVFWVFIFYMCVIPLVWRCRKTS